MYGLAFLTVNSGKSDPMIQHFKFLTVLELGITQIMNCMCIFEVKKLFKSYLQYIPICTVLDQQF